MATGCVFAVDVLRAVEKTRWACQERLESEKGTNEREKRKLQKQGGNVLYALSDLQPILTNSLLFLFTLPNMELSIPLAATDPVR